MENTSTSKDFYGKRKCDDTYLIDPHLIRENAFNARTDFGNIDELAQQIKEHGMLNAITVQPYKDENGEERYTLVDGARRLRAVMQLINNAKNENEIEHIKRIKAIVVPRALSEKDMYLQHIIRNDGKPFTDYELGVTIYNLKTKYGMQLTEIAKAIGKGNDVCTRFLQNLNRSSLQVSLLKDDKISTQTLVRLDREFGTNEKEMDAKLQELENERAKNKAKHISLKGEKLQSQDSEQIYKGIKLLTKYMKEFADGHNNKIPSFTMKGLLNELSAMGKKKNIHSVLEKLWNEQHSSEVESA